MIFSKKKKGQILDRIKKKNIWNNRDKRLGEKLIENKIGIHL